MLIKQVSRLLLLLSVLPAYGLAQGPPARPTDPSHFEVHKEENRLTPFDITVQFLFIDLSGNHLYITTVTDRDQDVVVGQGLMIAPMGVTEILHYYSGDSGLWSNWVWQGTRYDKVGGSPAVRSYLPISRR